jgi:hypothetical protein
MEDVFVNKRNLSPFALMQTFFDSGKKPTMGDAYSHKLPLIFGPMP